MLQAKKLSTNTLLMATSFAKITLLLDELAFSLDVTGGTTTVIDCLFFPLRVCKSRISKPVSTTMSLSIEKLGMFFHSVENR